MVRMEKVRKHYGTGQTVIPAVDDASLEVTDGEFIIITGPSGSGKTTLLNLVGGMTRPDSGSIEVGGRDLLALSDAKLSRFRARIIGFAFQFQSMIPTLNAIDNVRLPLVFASRDEGTDEAEDLLASVELGDRTQAFAHELSAGQQRRVCIARALANRPSLLLCDEPTGDLDPETEAVIMEIIVRSNQGGTTVMMTTHNTSLVKYASRTLRMERGVIHGGGDEDV